MAEDSSNPESSRPEDQEHSTASDQSQGADAQDPRDTNGNEGANPAEVESNESAEQIAEQSLETAERAAEEIKSQTGTASDSNAEEGNGSAAAAAQTDQTPGTDPLDLPDFTERGAATNGHSAGPPDLHLLNDIDLEVTVELGRTEMYVEDVLRLNENSVVELDKAAGDPVDIYVNNRHVARGEVLVLNENFCVRISEIIKQQNEEF